MKILEVSNDNLPKVLLRKLLVYTLSKLSAGFSLLEVLICLFLLSIMLLGLEITGFNSIEQFYDNWNRYVAIQQMINIHERLRALEGFAGLKNQITQWNQENAELLPNGEGNISGNFPDYQIDLYWDGKNKHELHEIIKI